MPRFGVGHPAIVLMDEPCSALDPRSTSRIEDLIAGLRGEYTIIIVTHNMQQAARVSDYTAFLYKGFLVEFGPARQLFTKPAKKETENYITGRFGQGRPSCRFTSSAISTD